MPKPHRRRRFFALGGQTEAGDSGESQEIAGSAGEDLSPTSVSSEDTEAAFGTTDQQPPPEYAQESDTADSAEDDALPPAFQLNRVPSDRPESKRLSFRWILLFLLLGPGIGMLAGYWLAKAGQKPPAGVDVFSSARSESNPLSAVDESDLDAAYSARHAHRYEEARQFFATLERRHPDWGPIKVELGRTLFYEGNIHDADVLLRRAEDKGWKPAEADFLLGVLNKLRKKYSEAEADFARAVAIDPTTPEHYFFWGECLREEGKLLEATAKFRSALLRNQYEMATGLYRAKLWLCAIEQDQGAASDLNAQIDENLKQPRPDMEAFIAAAARALRAGDFGAARAHLSRARRRADATVFRYILGDPVFAPARARPEFAEFFRPATPAADQRDNPTEGSPTPAATVDEPAKAKKP